jgi:hypothetical protein
MRRVWLAAVLLCALLLAVPAGASNSVTYADSTGENPNAPDITSIVVSNDDGGMLTFQVNISNRPALTQDMLIDIALDTDHNPATGDPQNFGAEYDIQLVAGEVDSFQWNGSTYVRAPSQSSLTYSYGSTGATIKISAADLGGTKEFNFAVLAVSGIAIDSSGNADFTNAQADLAPDPGHGTYDYKVLSAIKLTVVSFHTTPSPAKAGKLFAAAIEATENDTNGPIKNGTVNCRATLGGKPLTPNADGVANGLAICAWKLPKTAKGKRLSGTVTVTVQGVTVSRNFSVRVT